MTSLPDPHDTIAAVSTAPGRAARSVVRVTGPHAFSLIDRICPGWRSGPQDRPRRVNRVSSQVALPCIPSPLPVQLLVWPAPRTYTGQDLVEMHTFGSPPLSEALVAALIDAGARPARAGEFTLRAFLAGKLDLSQAEALLDLLHAENFEQMQAALAWFAGGVGKGLQDIRSLLLDLLAEIEAELDFAEEDLTFLPPETIAERLRQAEEQLLLVEQRFQERDVGAGPFRVVLAGPPNAGKSSLFNALIGRSAALVSPAPGTTRDWLEQVVRWEDVEIALLDSAGTGTTALDDLDRLAQEAADEVGQSADLILLCRPADAAEENRAWSRVGDIPMSRTVVIITKCDLAQSWQVQGQAVLRTSAATGEGIDALRRELVRKAIQWRGGFVSASRCRKPIQTAREHLKEAAYFAENRHPELAAAELRSALDALGEVVGAVCTDEILDRIFSQFCIGK